MITNLPVSEVAAVVARAVETLLGHDVVLGTGAAERGVPTAGMLPDGPTRTVVIPFADGVIGEVSLVVSEAFATAMEAATDDASLTAAALPALQAGAEAITFAIDIGVNIDGSGEISTETLLTSVVGDFAAVPIFENDTRVACLIVRVVDEPVPVPAAAPTSAPPRVIAAEMQPDPEPAVAVAAAPAATLPPERAPVEAPRVPALALHEFQPLHEDAASGAAPRPLMLLNDVHVEVTAELGRRRLKVRDIVALQPGSVVELDRAAGSPVDVLVNGALIWHGEVVVVDEEFGIRVAEIVTDEF